MGALPTDATAPTLTQRKRRRRKKGVEGRHEEKLTVPRQHVEVRHQKNIPQQRVEVRHEEKPTYSNHLLFAGTNTAGTNIRRSCGIYKCCTYVNSRPYCR